MPATTTASASATRCCARSSARRPAARRARRSCTWRCARPARARLRLSTTSGELERDAAIAAPLRRRRRPAGGAARDDRRGAGGADGCTRYAEVADLADRALELWPRVPGRRGSWPASTTSICCRSPPMRTAIAGERRAPSSCCARRCVSSAPTADPGRYAACWRGWHGRVVAEPRRRGRRRPRERALAMLCGRGRRPGRARCCWPGWRGRCSCAGASATRVATASGRWSCASPPATGTSRANVLNTLGMAQTAPAASVDEGVALLRRAIEIARDRRRPRRISRRLREPGRHARSWRAARREALASRARA